MSHARVNRGGGRMWAEGGYHVSLPPIFQKQLSPKKKEKKGKGKKTHLQRVLSSFFENKMIKGYLPSHPTSDASRAASSLSPLIMHAAAPGFALGWKLHARIKSQVHYRTSKSAPRLGQACPFFFFHRCMAGCKVFTEVSFEPAKSLAGLSIYLHFYLESKRF